MAKKARLGFKLPANWKAEAVTPRMSKGCEKCGAAPDSIRLVHVTQGFPFTTTSSYCPECALTIMSTELEEFYAENTKRIKAFSTFLEGKTP